MTCSRFFYCLTVFDTPTTWEVEAAYKRKQEHKTKVRFLGCSYEEQRHECLFNSCIMYVSKFGTKVMRADFSQEYTATLRNRVPHELNGNFLYSEEN